MVLLVEFLKSVKHLWLSQTSVVVKLHMHPLCGYLITFVWKCLRKEMQCKMVNSLEMISFIHHCRSMAFCTSWCSQSKRFGKWTNFQSTIASHRFFKINWNAVIVWAHEETYEMCVMYKIWLYYGDKIEHQIAKEVIKMDIHFINVVNPTNIKYVNIDMIWYVILKAIYISHFVLTNKILGN